MWAFAWHVKVISAGTWTTGHFDGFKKKLEQSEENTMFKLQL